MLSESERMLPGRYYVVPPKNQQAPAARIIALHGLFKSANAICNIVEALSERMPHVEIVVPNGWIAHKRDDETVFSWTMRPPRDLTSSFSLRKWLNTRCVDQIAGLKEKLDAERGKLPTGLYGFSEGGFFAAVAACHLPDDYPVTFCQSAFLTALHRSTFVENGSAPERTIAFCLQKDDSIFNNPWIAPYMHAHPRYAEWLQKRGVSVETIRLEGRHRPRPRALDYAAKFLSAHL